MNAIKCLSVDVEADEKDHISALLWSHGANAVVEIALEDGRVRLVAGFPSRDPSRVAEALAPRPTDVFDAAWHGWLEAWKPFARPVRAGSFAVVPAWQEVPSWADGLLLLRIDAGTAFGQGSHPTTRLALEALDALAVAQGIRGSIVLDAGCGSGILSVAAAVLGAARVEAVDVDPAAASATERNAASNGVSDRITVRTCDVALVDGRFDLILANLLAGELVRLAEHLERLLLPGGHLIVSGLRASQADRVVRAFRGLRVEEERDSEGWTALTFVAPFHSCLEGGSL
ncbi:MAG: hypothetical protein KatS3mg008_0998 [Acidimicrobiales bacterium]|nr:MAG: hypothetical protein KatS3mg008_0998 [Acidimicrobiales bacterium]